MTEIIHQKNAKLFTEKMLSRVKIVLSETQSSLTFNHNLENNNESDYLHSNVISVTNIIIYKANSINSSYQYKNTVDLLPKILFDDAKTHIMSYLDYRLDLYTIPKLILQYHKKGFDNYRKNCLSDMAFYCDHNWIQYNNNKNYYHSSFKVEAQELNILKSILNKNPYLKSIQNNN